MKLDIFHPSSNNSPFHIGIIPDGGRRWAKREGVSYLDSYSVSMKKLISILDELYSGETKVISVYFSSIQNFRRTNDEIFAFCTAESEFCDKHILSMIDKYNIKIEAIGDRDIIPTYLFNSIKRIEEKTAKNSGKKLFLCIAYNPLQEISEALAQLDKSTIKKNFLAHLWLPVPLDLVIRTGGANLLSNFLLLQSGFARLYFVEKLFNDLTNEDIQEILEMFKSVNRKYGN